MHRLRGQCSGQPLQQVLRLDVEQAVQPLRPDRQDREGPDAAGYRSPISTRPPASRPARICWTATRRFRPRFASITSIPTRIRRRRAPRASPSTARRVVQIGAKKEEAKSMTEEDVTGAIIRDLKSNTRNVCFLTGSGEHQIDDTDRPGLSHFKDLLSKDDYTAKSISLLEKPEVPADCTVLVVSGPEERLPAARSRCHQEICGRRRARHVPAGSAAEDRKAHRRITMRWTMSCRAGASAWKKILFWT